jgi:hypothetical protein
MLCHREAALMRASPRPKPLLQFQLGDEVLIEDKVGRVIGIRYGQIAYDVIFQNRVFLNVSPERVHLAWPAFGSQHGGAVNINE